MRRVLTVGVTYTDEKIEGVEIENLGLCQPSVNQARAAFPLYEYDTIIINPQSYTHFLLGAAGEFSDDPRELGKLKRQNDSYDIDTAFDAEDREKEMEAAIADGATVVWCLSEPRRMNFFGYRETHLGYAAPKIAGFVKRSDLLVKKGRRMGSVDPDCPFVRYFDVLSKTGWTVCLSDPTEGFASIASTPEGYSLGGRGSAFRTGVREFWPRNPLGRLCLRGRDGDRRKLAISLLCEFLRGGRSPQPERGSEDSTAERWAQLPPPPGVHAPDALSQFKVIAVLPFVHAFNKSVCCRNCSRDSARTPMPDRTKSAC